MAPVKTRSLERSEHVSKAKENTDDPHALWVKQRNTSRALSQTLLRDEDQCSSFANKQLITCVLSNPARQNTLDSIRFIDHGRTA